MNDYTDYKKYHFHYCKSKDQDAYLHRRETELRLYDGAVHMLNRFGIDPKTMNLEQMKADYHALEAKKVQMQKACKTAERDAELLRQKLANVQQYMGQTQTQKPERINNVAPKKDEQNL